MPYTITQLEKMAATDTPQKHALAGVKGIYYRLSKTERSWYWRGTLKGKKVPIGLGAANQRHMTKQWLEDEAKRLRDLCKAGIDPRDASAAKHEPEKTPTMDALWEKFLATKTTIKDAYREDIDGKWKRSCKTLHTLQPALVTTMVVSDLFDGYLTDGLISTAHHIKRILRPFFAWARRKYPVLASDLLDFKLPKERPTQDRLSAEGGEVQRFAKVLLSGHGSYSYDLRYNVAFLLLTGCRASFLVHWKPEWIVETPKGAFFDIPEGIPDLKDARFVLITPQVRSLLPLLKPCTKHTLRGCVVRVCKQAKVKMISSHDLRRTYISLGCEEPLEIAEEIMLAITDHKSKSQLGRIYNKRECLKMMPTALVVADFIWGLMGMPQTS